MLSALDTIQHDLARLQTRRLELLAGLEANGHAAEIGARDTIELIAVRHRLDRMDVRRDLRLANALPKYPDVQAALPAALHPAQAEAIVTALERIPATAMVPAETLQVAEQRTRQSPPKSSAPPTSASSANVSATPWTPTAPNQPKPAPWPPRPSG